MKKSTACRNVEAHSARRRKETIMMAKIAFTELG